jgi:hypothetical protein
MNYEADKSQNTGSFERKECEVSCENKSKLKKHVNEKHPKKIESNACKFTCISI